MSREQKGIVGWVGAAAAIAGILGGLVSAAFAGGQHSARIENIERWIAQHQAETAENRKAVSIVDQRLGRIEGQMEIVVSRIDQAIRGQR